MEEEKQDVVEETTPPLNDKDSILISIKKLLGISKECADFDTDIKIHINSTLMNLDQLGITIPKSFSVQDETQTWSEIIDDQEKIDSIITYVYLKVKLVFDPPLSSAVMEANKESIREIEWRLTVQVDENKLKEEGV